MLFGRGEASICRVSGPIGRSLFERKHSEKKTLERGRARLGWLRVKSWGEGERGWGEGERWWGKVVGKGGGVKEKVGGRGGKGGREKLSQV